MPGTAHAFQIAAALAVDPRVKPEGDAGAVCAIRRCEPLHRATAKRVAPNENGPAAILCLARAGPDWLLSLVPV